MLKAIFVLALIVMVLPTTVIAGFVGSQHSDVYHYEECHYARGIAAENRVYFSDAQEAEAAGYRPCLVCGPPKASTVKNTVAPKPVYGLPNPTPVPAALMPKLTPTPTPEPLPCFAFLCAIAAIGIAVFARKR